MRITKSATYDRFRCIAAACPDSCCKEWDVQVDSSTAEYYRSLPGPLGNRLREVLITDEDAGTIMTIENGRCPMWQQDGLCRIQAELGEAALCQVCREFPRLRHDYGNFMELGLELSCPEAARLILTSPAEPPITYEVPGGEAPEYDTDAMDILLRTRQEMLALLQSPLPLGETLALGLMYGYHAQSQLDGAAPAGFDPITALAEAREFAKPADSADLPRFYTGLEILTEQWRERLTHPVPSVWSESIRLLARYGVERYWLQAVSDYDLISRVKLVIASCLLVRILGGDVIETAQLYSKEIENDADNVEAILDAAYSHPAFTDDKLLWLLLN